MFIIIYYTGEVSNKNKNERRWAQKNTAVARQLSTTQRLVHLVPLEKALPVVLVGVRFAWRARSFDWCCCRTAVADCAAPQQLSQVFFVVVCDCSLRPCERHQKWQVSGRTTLPSVVPVGRFMMKDMLPLFYFSEKWTKHSSRTTKLARSATIYVVCEKTTTSLWWYRV